MGKRERNTPIAPINIYTFMYLNILMFIRRSLWFVRGICCGQEVWGEEKTGCLGFGPEHIFFFFHDLVCVKVHLL